MIGNDVVDLDDPESRSAARHARFDARAFTFAEQTMLRTSADGERLRWVPRRAHTKRPGATTHG